MKGRAFFLVICSIILIIFVSGCQFTIPDKFTGPAWTTKISMPLVMRTLKDGATYSEVRLDGQENGLGEKGIDLVGTNLSNFNIAPVQINGGEFGYITINSGVSFADITLPTVPATGTIPSTLPASAVSLGDYSGFTLSSNGAPYNTITISLQSATAGPGGLTVTFSNGTDVRTATIPNGGTTVNLSLTDFEITDSLSIKLSGDYNNGSGSGLVKFTISQLQISQFNVDGSKLNAVSGNLSFDTSQKATLPIGGNAFVLQLSALEFTIDGPELPANLIGTINLVLDGQNSAGVSVLTGGAKNYNVQIKRGAPQTITLTADINEILQNHPDNLVFQVSSISFNGVPGQTVIVKNTDKILLTITPKIGFKSLETAANSMNIGTIDQKMVQKAALNFTITNNTPLGLTLKAYLAPGSDVKTNPKRVELTLEIPPSDPGVPKPADSSLSITAQQLADLTGSGTIWNQFEITAAETTNQVQGTPAPYLEIQSYAQVELLVNKQ